MGLDLTQHNENAYTFLESEDEEMKMIIAIIKPDRLEAVKQELYKAT